MAEHISHGDMLEPEVEVAEATSLPRFFSLTESVHCGIFQYEELEEILQCD